MTTESSIGRLLGEIEGARLPTHDLKPNAPVKCDYCSENIKPNREVAIYFSDTDLNRTREEFQPGNVMLQFQRVYGPCCDRRTILFPCRNVLELLAHGRVTPDRRLVDLELADASAPSEGVPWNPLEVFETVWGVSFADHQRTNLVETTRFGPEDMIDHLLHMDVDPREVIDEDGEPTVTPEVEAKITARAIEKVEGAESLEDLYGDQFDFEKLTRRD